MTIALMLFGMLALAVLNVPIAIALGFVAMVGDPASSRGRICCPIWRW